MAKTHKCNWHGCNKLVASWRWGCPSHFGALPFDIRLKLKRIKPYWPEYKAIKKEAIQFSKSEQGSKRDEKQNLCDCGQPRINRLPRRECLDCHKKRLFSAKNQPIQETQDQPNNDLFT